MRKRSIIGLSVALGLVVAMAGPAWAATTLRVSLDAAGMEGALPSRDPEVNVTGQFVVFESEAALVATDLNGINDIYMKNLATGGIVRVSERLGGGDANGASYDPAISTDARWVTYSSDATDLVANDLNALRDAFLFDRTTGNTRIVSIGAMGQANGPSEHPKVSAGPNPVVVFDTIASNLSANDGNGAPDVYARAPMAGVTRLISANPGGFAGNGASSHPDITPGANRVAYQSTAFDLAPDPNGPIMDVFLTVTGTGATGLVSGSVANPGNGPSGMPDIANTGFQVAFHSDATNMVPVDPNMLRDVFWKNLVTGATRLVSRAPGGPPANGPSQNPTIKPDGTWVAFESAAVNLVGGDTNMVQDIFATAIGAAFLGRVSVNSGGNQANGASSTPGMGENGAQIAVAFDSDATNLDPADLNGVRDVFEFRP